MPFITLSKLRTASKLSNFDRLRPGALIEVHLCPDFFRYAGNSASLKLKHRDEFTPQMNRLFELIVDEVDIWDIISNPLDYAFCLKFHEVKFSPVFNYLAIFQTKDTNKDFMSGNEVWNGLAFTESKPGMINGRRKFVKKIFINQKVGETNHGLFSLFYEKKNGYFSYS